MWSVSLEIGVYLGVAQPVEGPPEPIAAIVPATPEKIAQQSPLVSHLLLRWLGAWLDLLVVMFLLAVPDFILGNATYRATIVIWLAAAFLYFPIAESIWGRTVGKLITGMIVVDKDGHPPGFLKAVLRTLLRLIEVNPVLLGGLPAYVVVMSEKRQRLGDMLARTYVVRVKALANAKALSGRP
jgi:uncharacterized RDD family membrane protein YckC